MVQGLDVHATVPVVEPRDTPAQLVVAQGMRQDGEEVAERSQILGEAPVRLEEGAHARGARRKAARLARPLEALVMCKRVDDGGHEGRLAAEVIPHRVAVGARLGGDRLHGQRLVAAARQQTACGGHQALGGGRQLRHRVSDTRSSYSRSLCIRHGHTTVVTFHTETCRTALAVHRRPV